MKSLAGLFPWQAGTKFIEIICSHAVVTLLFICQSYPLTMNHLFLMEKQTSVL